MIEVNLKNNKFLNISEIADSITYIPLETTDECLIGAFCGIQYKNGIWYISDRTYTIFLFDDNGKFIKKLNKIGQGPGEYTYIQTFAVDNDNHIHISDFGLKKILEYNADLEYVSATRFEDVPRDFYVLEDKYVLYMPDQNTNCRRGIYSLNRKTGKYQEILNMKGLPETVYYNKWIVSSEDNKFIILDCSSNRAIYMHNDSILKTITFSGNEIGDPTDNKTYSVGSLEDYGNILFISFWKNEYPGVMGVYDKTKATMTVYSDGKNDIDGKEFGLSTYITFKNIGFSLCSGDLNEEFDESNPIIQKIYFKQ